MCTFGVLGLSCEAPAAPGKGTLTVSSWRKSCCPGGASCCGGLEERR